MVSDWTRAPIEDGVDGTGVYASRLRSRRSARGPQSPKVLVPGGIHVRSDIRRLGRNLHSILTFFLNGYSDQSISRSFDFLDQGGESVSSHGPSNGLEETPPTRRKRNT